MRDHSLVINSDVKTTMVSLANLAKVNNALTFLFEMGIVKQDAIEKGCRKFVNEHPEIQKTFDSL